MAVTIIITAVLVIIVILDKLVRIVPQEGLDKGVQVLHFIATVVEIATREVVMEYVLRVSTRRNSLHRVHLAGSVSIKVVPNKVVATLQLLESSQRKTLETQTALDTIPNLSIRLIALRVCFHRREFHHVPIVQQGNTRLPVGYLPVLTAQSVHMQLMKPEQHQVLTLALMFLLTITPPMKLA
jgi:hypothetical protein